jgi:hypothetical protein
VAVVPLNPNSTPPFSKALILHHPNSQATATTETTGLNLPTSSLPSSKRKRARSGRPYSTAQMLAVQSTPAYAVQEGDACRPAHAGQGIGWEGSGWTDKGLRPGAGGEETLGRWLGWSKGRQYTVKNQGLVLKDTAKL